MLEVEWTQTPGKHILNFLLHLSQPFFLIQSVPCKHSAINCIAYTQTEETLSYTMLHPSVTRSRLHWNLWIRWCNVNVSATIRLAVCELYSGRVNKGALRAISRKELQTVFNNHFVKYQAVAVNLVSRWDSVFIWPPYSTRSGISKESNLHRKGHVNIKYIF